MNIKILSFSSEIEDLKNNKLFHSNVAKKYPGALWVSYLKNKCPFNLEFQTVDITLKLVKSGKIDPTKVLVFQHNLDPEASQLIKLGAIPFLLSMFESPLYCGEFYDTINDNIRKFNHIKIFGGNNYNTKNLSQAYFPCFSHAKLLPQQYQDWKDRKFASMVMGNKYVLTRKLHTFNYWQDWIWWAFKATHQYLKGPKLPKIINVQKIQLQDLRYELLKEMLEEGLLDLYGKGWDKLIRIPPSTAKKLSAHIQKKGVSSIKNKEQVISAYKFNICFENLSYPGYVTEKIIDAFNAGTIPVYCGAPDIYEYIPLGSFINASQFDNIQDLIKFLSKINPNEAQLILENGQKFLRSSLGIKFSYENFADEIIKYLEDFFKYKSSEYRVVSHKQAIKII